MTTSIRQMFVDTSAWITLMNKNERYHADAVALHKELDPLILYITSWGIVAETFTWCHYHVGHHEAMRWLSLKDSLERKGSLQIVYPSTLIEPRVRTVINRFHDQKLSYVDAFSIALIQTRPEIDAVFAFDHHMALAGIPVLPGVLS